MGQKAHPKSLRLKIVDHWDSVWFASSKKYPEYLREDFKIRKFLKQKLYKAGVARVVIERKADRLVVEVYAARPGLIIGRGGRSVEVVRDELIAFLHKPLELNIREEDNPEISSQLVAENIAMQLEKRIAFRRAMKQAVTKALRLGAKGIKVMVGGRLGGSEIARSEWYRRGRVPLGTFRSKIEYGFTEAMTVYGKIGVKIWIYKGDVIGDEMVLEETPPMVEA